MGRVARGVSPETGGSRRLVVELDGDHHGEERQAEHDWLSDKILAREGFQILRFWNRDLDGNVEGVVNLIVQALSNRCPTRSNAVGVGLPSP